MLIRRLKNNGSVELWLNKLQLKTRGQVEEKIISQVYRFENKEQCVICNSTDALLIGERDRYGLYYPVNICKGCGFVFVNPRMDQSAYNEFYNEEYRKLFLGSEKPTDFFFQQQYNQGKRIYDFLVEHHIIGSEYKSVLEVGCGAGGILKYFNEKGFEVQGLDLGEEYVRFGRDNYSLDLYSTNLKNFRATSKPDIIIYSHVLEHLLDLEEELRLIKEISQPHTKLYIEVPGLKQMHQGYDLNILKYFQISHIYHFTLTSLVNLLNKNEFDLIVGNEQVRSVFQLSKSSNHTITTDYEPAINYIKKYERLRWLFYLTPRAIKYYTGMVIIKTLDRLGVKEKVKKLVKKQTASNG